MAVINSVLGEGMSSRLFTEIRDKRGLAYTVLLSSIQTAWAPRASSPSSPPIQTMWMKLGNMCS